MSRHTFKTLALMILSLVLTLAFLTGCNSAKTQSVKSPDNTPVSSNTPAPSTTPAPEDSSPAANSHSVNLTLYFPNADATGLIPTQRTANVTDQEVIKTIFKELASPPAGLQKPLPQGTSLLSATVSADGVATIDLSSEFKKNFSGGSAGEEMTIYSIVNTLTTLPDVHTVQFLLNGKKEDGILGNLDTSIPLKQNTSLNLPAK